MRLQTRGYRRSSSTSPLSRCAIVRFRKLTSKLKRLAYYPDREHKFFQLMQDSVDFVLDLEAEMHRAFFVINAFCHNQLFQAERPLTADVEHIPILVQWHRGKQGRQHTLHSYEEALPVIQRLATSTWANNAQLHEIEPRYM